MSVRIIAGQWRSRKLDVPEALGLRPTPNRVRETLFNWLMDDMVGAHCLDAFAGSGALGFEALSRGAAHVTFIDSNPQVIKHLRTTGDLFKTTQASYVLGSFPNKVVLSQPFDIVFLDPPFHQGLIEPSLEFLTQNNLLKPGALIYIEQESLIPSHPNFTQLKSKTTGQVSYSLWRA